MREGVVEEETVKILRSGSTTVREATESLLTRNYIEHDILE